MNAKILVFATCVEAIRYLYLYNLHDCTIELSYLFSRWMLLSKKKRRNLESFKHYNYIVWVLVLWHSYYSAAKL